MKKSLSYWLLGLIGCITIVWLVFYRPAQRNNPVINALSALSIDDIVSLLQDADPIKRDIALVRLTRDYSVEERMAAIPSLLNLLKVENYSLSIPVALAQLGHHDSAVVQALCDTLKRQNTLWINCNIISTLGNMGIVFSSATSLAGHFDVIVVQAFCDSRRRQRNQADQGLIFNTLGNMGSAASSATSTIATYLKDDSEWVQVAAAETIGKISDKPDQAVATLKELLYHKSVGVQQHAARTLACLGPRARQAVPALKSACGDSVPEMRIAAAVALRHIDLDQHEVIIRTLTDIVKQNRDSSLAILVAQTLMEMKAIAKPAVPVLQEMMKSTHHTVRETAREALEAISPGSSFEIDKR